MTRSTRLIKLAQERLGLAADDFVVRHCAGRGAPVLEVNRGRLNGHRYTDVGRHGLGLYEIVDDDRGSFVNVLVVELRPARSRG